MELFWNDLLAPLLWILWCSLHSTLVATPVTDWMKKIWSRQFRFYRLFFSAFSVATLIPLITYSIYIDGEPVFRWEGFWIIAKYGLLVTALFLFFAGGRHYNLWQLLGIRQIRKGRTGQALWEYNRLDTSGILGIIRHPWYTAGILLVWARDMTLSALVINIVISAYFVVGTVLEEHKLLLAFGESYRKYQGRVSMFVPFKWLKARFASCGTDRSLLPVKNPLE
jgi:protein-S-isoprenylcysteine O-methyltransferase Ste14